MRMKLLTLALLILALTVTAYPQEKPDSPPDKPDKTDKPDTPEKVDSSDPLAVLKAALKDEKDSAPTLLALRAVHPGAQADKDLVKLFEAYSRSGDKQIRMFATTTVAEMGGKAEAAVLLERLRDDPTMAVRSEALMQLLSMNAINDDQLRAALKVDDENVQCMAARSLVTHKQTKEAIPVLARLTKSKDQATACMSRMSLLLAGDDGQAEPLRTMMTDPKTPEDVLALLLEQVSEEKIMPARDLVRAVIDSQADGLMKVRGYKAMAVVDPGATAKIVAAIRKSKDLIVRVHLVRVLCDRHGGFAKASTQPDTLGALDQIAKEDDAAGVMARMDLARAKGDADKLKMALRDAFALGHPILIDYVLVSAKEDLKNRPDSTALLATYVEPLLDFVRSVPTDPENMQKIHHRAAAAVTWLADLGSPKAVAGLQNILAGKYTAIVRATATGLGRSNNQELACRLAKPMLKSVYHDLAVDGALTLGRWGDKAASEVLDRIIASQTDPAVLKALACWYTLRIQGRTKEASKELVKLVK